MSSARAVHSGLASRSQRVQVASNKGEAHNSFARALFFEPPCCRSRRACRMRTGSILFRSSALSSTLVCRKVINICVRSCPCFKARSSFPALRAVMWYIDYSLWQFIIFLVAAYPTWSPKNLCLSYLKRGHTSSKSSSRLCMTICEAKCSKRRPGNVAITRLREAPKPGV